MLYFDQLNESIKEIEKLKKPEKLLIGYRMYFELMQERKFFEEVVGSSMNPNKRKYKQIKIKITQDEYQLLVI
ncbi:hypothetical protein [Acinetobacter populi]|uniref:Uncharacterized protein n=1 Tax=Acinetobacter populi TaxID=1582270 RepID=A0A1Z9YYU3_9GAMM|nr:hypothetical protein [Acinetobacter populi]OUY07394.1 hypothetical protein CAP51_06410 [Acinetobacter populi]